MAKYSAADISLQGAFGVERLRTLSLEAGVNRHGVLTYSGYIEEASGIALVERRAQGEQMTLEIGGTPVFRGQISSVEANKENGLLLLAVSCVSSSKLLDLTARSRSFQDVRMSYGEMLKQVYEEAGASIITPGGDSRIGAPLLQYQETDWAYTLRMAGRIGAAVVPNLTAQGAQVSFGLPKGNRYTVSPAETEYMIQRRNMHYIRSNLEYDDTRYRDFLQYTIRDSRMFRLGDQITVQGEDFSVVGLHVWMENGLVESEYLLGRERAFCAPRRNNEIQAGLTLSGTVLDTEGQTVKVHLDIDEEQEKSKAYSFPYAPQTNNGMYCMPQVGTRVMLRWKSAQDGDAAAIHCIRTNGMGDYHCRYFTTEFGKQLAMLPAALSFSGDTSSIKLQDSRGIAVKTSGHISLKAAKLLKIHSLKRVVMKTPELMKFSKAGTTTAIDVSGGNMHLHAPKVFVHGNLNGRVLPAKPVYKRPLRMISAQLIAAATGMIANGMSDPSKEEF